MLSPEFNARLRDDAGRRHAGHLRVRCAVEPTGRFGDHARVRGGCRAKRRGADEHRQHRVRVQGDVSVHGRRAQQRDGRFQHAGRAERVRTRAFGGNFPAPKRPPSSMSPTIVVDPGAGATVAAAGASGGPRIITAAHVLLNVLARGASPLEAVEAPRVHHQLTPNTVFAGRSASWARTSGETCRTRRRRRCGRGDTRFHSRRRHGDDATHHGGSGDGEGTRGERRGGGAPAAQDSNEARG